jgi:hypothetical protein
MWLGWAEPSGCSWSEVVVSLKVWTSWIVQWAWHRSPDGFVIHGFRIPLMNFRHETHSNILLHLLSPWQMTGWVGR